MREQQSISFATIDLSGQKLSQRKRRPKADPYHPARQLFPQEITDNISEDDDGLLWGAYDIPIYMNPPVDRSNRDTIDFEMADEYNYHQALRVDDVLFVNIFDASTQDGLPVNYDDPTKLPKTEAYDKLVSINDRLSEDEVLNPEDLTEKEDAYAIEKLELQAMIIAWLGHIPEDWANQLHGWLVSKDATYDQIDYNFKPEDVFNGMKELGFLNPQAMKELLLPDERERVEEVERGIALAEKQFVEYFQARPELLPQYSKIEVVHQQELAKLNALYTRLLRQEKEPVELGTGQLEMAKMLKKIDPLAQTRNEEILKRIEEEKNTYIAKLKALLNDAASEMTEDTLEDDQDDLIFASNGRKNIIRQ